MLPPTALSLEPRPWRDGSHEDRSRRTGLLAVKCGMTCDWTEWGERLPLTVLWIDDCQARALPLRRGRSALGLRLEACVRSSFISCPRGAGGASQDGGEGGLQLGAGWRRQQEGEAGAAGAAAPQTLRAPPSRCARGTPPRRPGLTRPRRLSPQLSSPERGHYKAASLPYKRVLREFRVSLDALLPVGTTLSAAHFAAGQEVDIAGTTRGHGFAGVMKRRATLAAPLAPGPPTPPGGARL